MVLRLVIVTVGAAGRSGSRNKLSHSAHLWHPLQWSHSQQIRIWRSEVPAEPGWFPDAFWSLLPVNFRCPEIKGTAEGQVLSSIPKGLASLPNESIRAPPLGREDLTALFLHPELLLKKVPSWLWLQANPFTASSVASIIEAG